jgi:hypothetical protein
LAGFYLEPDQFLVITKHKMKAKYMLELYRFSEEDKSCVDKIALFEVKLECEPHIFTAVDERKRFAYIYAKVMNKKHQR